MTLHRKITGLMASSLVLMLSVACSRRVATAPFPASNDVAGWAKIGETRTFTASELWSYVDGDAERYVKAGVQSTSTADYKFKDQFDAAVDIYTMSSAAGARTILDSEPAGEAKFAPIGDSARLHSASLVFCKGPYLVRIVAYRTSPETQPALQDLGREIDRRLRP